MRWGGVDAVCHQAAMVGLGVDLEDVTGYVGHNDMGTPCCCGRSLAGDTSACRPRLEHGRLRGGPLPLPRARGRPPRAARHPDLEAGRYEPSCPECGRPLAPEAVGEDAPVDPRNIYAATKLHQEHLAAAFSRETGIPVAALRYHNVFGPRMPRDTPYAGVAAIFSSAIAAGRPRRSWRTAGSCATSCTSATSRGRTCWR